MKKIISLATIFAILIFSAMTVSASEIPAERLLPRLVDDADLLSDAESQRLLEKLDDVSERGQCDVVVVTVRSLDGKSPMAFADDYFDYNGYGYGVGDDGVLLLLSMLERDWYITTHGYGITAFTDYGIETIGDEIVPYLSDGDYYTAFDKFADIADSYISQARSGTPFDYDTEPVDIGSLAVISFIVGLVIALIVTGVMRAQLKSVRPQNSANAYTIDGSMQITNRRDMFLYRNVSRRARPKESSSGGSSTHRSSSGRSHGGGGGKF